MLDLKKLEAKFKIFFEEETEESFNEWVEEKKKSEILARLGNGDIEKIDPPVTQGLNFHCHKLIDFGNQAAAQMAGNSQFNQAA